jgi:hypothetical protein
VKSFPDRPFLPSDFSPKGGGLDFLGTRWVNLSILGDKILPGINNITQDFGMYCLGTWIPWKFGSLCNSQAEFTFSNYKRFREAVEVIISYVIRTGSPSTVAYGEIHNKVGRDQKLSLPSPLTFETANRSESNTIYAAPLYGPSLNYLGLLRGVAQAVDGTSTRIPLVDQDESTRVIIQKAEEHLKASSHYAVLNRLPLPSLDGNTIDDLGSHGLNPSVLRAADKDLKSAFLNKLLPRDGTGKGRTLTARLIGETVRVSAGLDSRQLRAVWHTTLTPSGTPFELQSEEVRDHNAIWSIFQARQIQRTFLEGFLHSFELALCEGCRSIESIVDYFVTQWKQAGERVPSDLDDLIRREVQGIANASDLKTASEKWNEKVHGGHARYDDMPAEGEKMPCIRATRMLARWFLRTYSWSDRYNSHKNLLEMGGAERISMSYCLQWIDNRRSIPFPEFLKQLFTDFVFVQHMRVALNRFDGQTQRLRFVLGDAGIVRTVSARNLGKGFRVMADRLDCFLTLLVDLEVLNDNGNHTFSLGPNAHYIV